MKKILSGIFLFVIFLFLLLISPNSVYAQACTGDSGGPGQCMAAMACPPSRIDGQGDCPGDPLTGPICCLDDEPCGTVGCGGSCNNTDDCRCGFTCTNDFCSHPTQCASCTGDSGYPGVCLTPATCNGLGRNSNDGLSTCPPASGFRCCTEAPSGNTCSMSASPALVGAVFTVSLTSTTPNVYYTITSSPVCVGSCFAATQTDASGNLSCTADCGPPAGDYTFTARYADTECSLTVDVRNDPGLPCTGIGSGRSGYCVVLFCPQGHVADGGYPAVCNIPDQRCCVPESSLGNIETPLGGGPCGGDEFDTAIGCIPASDSDQFIEWVLRWSFGIGGGIAFLLIIFSGFQIITSSGDPKRMQAGRELLTAAVSGLILLIFSVFILRLIGVDILGIPGFGN